MKKKYELDVENEKRDYRNNKFFQAKPESSSKKDKEEKLAEKMPQKYSKKAVGNFKKWMDDEVEDVVAELREEQANRYAEDYEAEDTEEELENGLKMGC